MKDLGRGSILNNLDIKPHNILFTYTTPNDYEMERIIILENMNGLDDEGYIVLEGGHCSCYDFDEVEWFGTSYTTQELKLLANADYNSNHPLWKMVREYFG